MYLVMDNQTSAYHTIQCTLEITFLRHLIVLA